MRHRCLTDIAGPFYDTTKPFRNWSALPFYQLDLPDRPYVNQQQLAHGLDRALVYLDHIHAQGYTGITVDNLAHLVTFARAPVQIYRTDSPYLQRAAIYRAAFLHLFERAAQLEMEVFVTTDMQWSTPPVLSYIGSLAAGNPRLAAINRWAVDELFVTLPQISGLIVRTGEAGGAHNQDIGYASHVLYRTGADLRGLIATLLGVCERRERLLIMRTWSIGIGELGDLHWSPTRYQSVFGGFDSPWLITSIKHGPSDFFRLLPDNSTLGLPGPQQIVELQNRREYELFGMIPSSVAQIHQHVVQHEEANPGWAGVWAWNSTGGWGGGRAALGAQGWSVWTELSSALTAALIRNPELDTSAWTQRWCAERFGSDVGTAVSDVYLESSELIALGWYGGALARGEHSIGGLYLPSLLWVWWMRPTASLMIWAYLASMIDDWRASERTRAAAVERLDWHAKRLAACVPPTDADAAALVASVRYMASAFAVAHAIRSFMEPAFDAAWRGSPEQWYQVLERIPEVRAALARHQERWRTDADFPALELAEIEAFLHALERAPRRIWLQARVACRLVARLRDPQRPSTRTQATSLLAASAVLIALTRRRHQGTVFIGVLASVLLAVVLRRRAIQIGLPWLSRRFYLLPSIFFETGPALTEWAD